MLRRASLFKKLELISIQFLSIFIWLLELADMN
jgi:hypothetical protein